MAPPLLRRRHVPPLVPLLPRSPTPLLDLSRAHSAAGAALAVWVGGRLAGASWAAWWLAPMAVAFLLSAAGNALNDAHDAPVDRINRPHRPIPRGALTPAQARGWALACAAFALLLALPFGPGSTLGALLGIALLVLYTTHLKNVPLVGNGVVGLLAGMAVGYGGLLGGNVGAVLLPGATLGLLFGGRELLKTVHDLPGDRAHGLRTVASVAGARVALRAATLCTGAALALLAAWAGTAPARGAVWVLTMLVSLVTLGPLWQQPHERGRVAWALRWSKALGLLLLVGLSVAG